MTELSRFPDRPHEQAIVNMIIKWVRNEPEFERELIDEGLLPPPAEVIELRRKDD